MKCAATGKTMYVDKRKAHDGMMHIYGHDPNAKFGDLEVYPCGHCHTFHTRHTDAASKRIHMQKLAQEAMK